LALTSPTKQILEVSNVQVQSNQHLTTHETSKGEGQIKIEEKKIRVHITNLLNERYGLNTIDKNISLDFEVHVLPDDHKYVDQRCRVLCTFVTCENQIRLYMEAIMLKRCGPPDGCIQISTSILKYM
jgi:hypothetical protein